MSALRAHLQPHLILVGFFIPRIQVELLVEIDRPWSWFL